VRNKRTAYHSSAHQRDTGKWVVRSEGQELARHLSCGHAKKPIPHAEAADCWAQISKGQTRGRKQGGQKAYVKTPEAFGEGASAGRLKRTASSRKRSEYSQTLPQKEQRTAQMPLKGKGQTKAAKVLHPKGRDRKKKVATPPGEDARANCHRDKQDRA